MSFEPRLFAGDDADADPSNGLGAPGDRAPGDDCADGAFELPDDLVELASQLTCDANHLALRYPAGQISRKAASNAVVAAITEHQKSNAYRRPAFPWRAAMAFLVSGVVIWTASHAVRRHSPAVQDAKHDQASVAGFEAVPVTSKPGDSRLAIADIGPNNATLPKRDAAPAAAEFNSSTANESLNTFEKLSGAEQEAVLDLLEHRPAAKEVWEI